MTVSRPSLRIRRGRWRTRALAASPTAAERTARCSTGVRRAPKNSSAMTRSCSSHCSASSADLGAGARASNSSARRRAVRRWTGMLPRSISRLGCRWCSCPFQRTIMGSPSRNVPGPPSPSVRRPAQPPPASQSIFAYTLHCSGKSGMRPGGLAKVRCEWDLVLPGAEGGVAPLPTTPPAVALMGRRNALTGPGRPAPEAALAALDDIARTRVASAAAAALGRQHAGDVCVAVEPVRELVQAAASTRSPRRRRRWPPTSPSGPRPGSSRRCRPRRRRSRPRRAPPGGRTRRRRPW